MRKGWLLILLLLACLGCQAPDPSIELLESELRWMEDQLYFLDRQLDQTCNQLASCQRNNSALRQQLATRAADASTPSPATPSSGRPRSTAPPSTTSPLPPRSTIPAPANDRESDESGPTPPKVRPVPDNSIPSNDDLRVPDVEMGPETDPAAPADGVEGDSARRRPATRADVDVAVARIVLNSRLTGGYESDQQAGDDGLMVVIEPQNAAGQYLPLPGDLTIRVVDPAAATSVQEVARWDFDASETVPLIKKSLFGRGVHLQLPWPNQAPRSRRLQVVVRYVTPAGESLVAEREVRIDPIADVTNTGPLAANSLPTSLESVLPAPPIAIGRLMPPHAMQAPSAPRVAVARNADAWVPQREPTMVQSLEAPSHPAAQSARRTLPALPALPEAVIDDWQPYR